MPSHANCKDKLFTRLVVPDLITFDRIRTSIGSLTEDEVMVSIEPPPLLLIDGRTDLIILTALIRFSSKAFIQSSSVNISNFPGGGPPAFTTNKSTPP